MKAKNKIFVILTLVLMVITMSGCSESSQLHQKLIIQGIGVDLEEKDYKVTIQAYDYQNPTSTNEPTLKIIELTGQTIMDSFSSIHNQTGLKPLYSQNMLIVLGEDVAKEGVSKIFDFFIRHYEVRPDVKICVAKNRASSILKCEMENGYVKMKDVSELVYEKSDIIHFVNKSTDGTSSPSLDVLKLVENDESGENKVLFDGVACFKYDKLTSIIDMEHTKGIHLINGNCIGKTYVVDIGENEKVSCTVKRISNEIRPIITEHGLEFDVNLKADVEILEVTRQNIGIGTTLSKHDVESSISIYISELCKKTIEKVILKDSTDIFRFGRVLLNTNPNYFRNIDDWTTSLKDANYNVNTEVQISVTGTELVF